MDHRIIKSTFFAKLMLISAFSCVYGQESFLQELTIKHSQASRALIVGQDSAASNGFDLHFDKPAPPMLPRDSFDARILYDQGELVTDWFRDVRSIADSNVFQISIKNPGDTSSISLSWPSLVMMGSLTLSVLGENIDLTRIGEFQIINQQPGAVVALVTYHKDAIATSLNGPAAQLDAFGLEQNYPNPFNPSTTIRFRVRVPAVVNLSIYNTLGQLVRTLVDGNVIAGEHSWVWNATDQDGQRVSSGVYVYRIDVFDSLDGRRRTFTSKRKLVLLK